MGVPDTSLLDLIDKVRSWASWGGNDLSSFTSEFEMAGENSCRECDVKFTELSHKYSCQGCRRLLCGLCVRASGSLVIIATSNGRKDINHMEKVIKACKICSKASKRHIEKVYPSESPRASPEPASPSCGCEEIRSDENAEIIEEDCIPHTIEFLESDFSPHKIKCSAGHQSQSSFRHSPIQSDEEAGRHFFSSSREYYHDSLDIGTSVSFRHECYSFRSGGSSPLDSPSRFNINTPRAGLAVQQPRDGIPIPQNSSLCGREVVAVLRRPGDPENGETIDIEEKPVKPLDFGKDVHVWFPPPPEDEDDEAENNYFEYDDDDDDVNDDGGGVEEKEPLKAVIQGHFRALVSQLLQGEGIKTGKEYGAQNWLDIVSSLAWQAANFVKPDTTKGGSMDPVDYVKIKCIASGSPRESTLVKGVVCTKNIKHKRMTSQYRNPRVLLLGGSLEYQRAQNQLASFNTLLEEEMNHLKMIVSKIEAHRTNVLLVEKSVSSYAQDYLLAKEISLVLNVKRPLLERVARCTGASITRSVDNISMARIGHCELFRLEKVSKELETPNQFNRRPIPSKTLMYFEGCPRRLGCTVLLKGLCREELKKIKHVVQYAVFAAYHLSLETSFLADEGAHLPKMTIKPSYSVSDSITADYATSTLPTPETITPSQELKDVVDPQVMVDIEDGDWEPTSEHLNFAMVHTVKSTSPSPDNNMLGMIDCASSVINSAQSELLEIVSPEEGQLREMEKVDENEVSNDYFTAAESHQSILVSFSSRCVSKGTPCERSRLLRIRFYGSFDKPLRRYLRDDLFDQASVCRSCKEPVEAHVQCYTHRQGSLSINVRRLDTLKLPGERDGKIWTWHRCLRCAQIDGIPPATRRVLMSDAALGLSFGKFLELSFSNNATANRVASCGHSLQRDCLRFYGFGSMVVFFHYSQIDIMTVHLPPSMLEFNGHSKQAWIRREVEELKSKMEILYVEISDILHVMEQKSTSLGNGHGPSDSGDLHIHILELKDLLDKERDDYQGLLKQASEENSLLMERTFDILELNRLRRSLLIGLRAWDRRNYSLYSLLNSRHFSFEASEGTDVCQLNQAENHLPLKRVMAPVRVYSFDSAMRIQEKLHPSHLSAVRSFHAFGDYNREPTSNVMANFTPSFISSVTCMAEGPRLLLPQAGYNDVVIAVYDDEPTSVISYALSSKEYEDWVSDKLSQDDSKDISREDCTTSTFLSWQSFGSLEMDFVSYGSYGSEVASSRNSMMFSDPKRSPHLQISFDDDSSIGGGKVKFSVTCYFAKQFDMLRKKCCPSEVDFVCSLCRCRRWSAQGGKSNVYFAKSMDERFIIKQVTKIELESFQEFAPEYFKYLNDSLDSGSPTCLAKILGIFQVTIKYLKGGRETKMDLMVMENLFYKRSTCRIYDLKGSLRSRYNTDTTGANKVLLDMNLLETLRTNPIFLGSKAKRRLERAVWNDTSFLASVDVMDYSLLVGVDEGRKELVLGIIDYMRQYTWDKHLETWVKASGILGGSKNASPTIISPKQYKIRFRKAMTTYFLTVPDQWSS